MGPTVWLGCVECYDAGSLTGSWFPAWSAPADMAELESSLSSGSISRLHRNAGHAEISIFDWSGFAGVLPKGATVEDITEYIASQRVDVPADLRVPFAAYVNYLGRGDNPREYLNDFRERYIGIYADYNEYVTARMRAAFPPDVDLNAWPYNSYDPYSVWSNIVNGRGVPAAERIRYFNADDGRLVIMRRA